MKKFLILMAILAMAVPCSGADLTWSVDDYRTTVQNGYAWSGNIPRDRMRTWSQEMETGRDDFYTTPITNVTSGSTTLTDTSTGYVIVLGTTGKYTPTVTLPTAVAGKHFVVIDNSASETTKIITASVSDTLQISGATTTNSGAVANKGSITLLAIKASATASNGTWVVLSAVLPTDVASWTNY